MKDMRDINDCLEEHHKGEDPLSITQLNCSSNNLTSLNGIEQLTNLTHLNCSSNNLTSLNGIEQLINLTDLYCYINNLPADYPIKIADIRAYLIKENRQAKLNDLIKNL